MRNSKSFTGRPATRSRASASQRNSSAQSRISFSRARHEFVRRTHNDHHPEDELFKDGFVDFHVMFRNDAVAHHYLVYEERGHFSKIVSINVQGGVSVYRLPFWHYTTPLAGKPRREAEARRWLLLGTFQIV